MQKKRKLVTREVLLLTLPALIPAAFLLLPQKAREKGFQAIVEVMKPSDKRRRNLCYSTIIQVGMAVQLYQQDHSGYYPHSGATFPATEAGKGWAIAIQPNLKCYTCLQCPEDSHAIKANPAQPRFTDYWFNEQLSGQKAANVSQPQFTLMLGDGNDGTDKTDSTYSIGAFPAYWLSNSTKPPFRHLGGANYVFVDGHVKWLKPDEVAHFGGRTDPFALK